MNCRCTTLIFVLFTGWCNTAWEQQSNLSARPSSYAELLQQADSQYFKGQWKNAVILYNKALRDTSSSALYNYRLGYSRYMDSDFAGALKSFEKSFSENPPPQVKFVLYSMLLASFEHLHMAKEALAFFKDAVDKGFFNFILLESSPAFEEVRQTDTYRNMIERAKRNAYPCLTDTVHNSYDFWVGDWDVYSTGAFKTPVGISSITKEDGGCVIIEHFKSLVAPGSGHSINYVNSETQKWEQVYSGAGGATQKYIDGEYRDSAMRFTYTASRNGSSGTGNFIFYNQGPDQFRQYQDISFDGGKTFQVLTDLTYKRRKDKAVF